MSDDFRSRETLTTVLKRHRQVSRLLAESSMSGWQTSVGSGYHSDHYQTAASTLAELARLLAPKLIHTDIWTQQLATVHAERLAQNSRSNPSRSTERRDTDEGTVRIQTVDQDEDSDSLDGQKSLYDAAKQNRNTRSAGSTTDDQRSETVSIRVSLKWIVNNNAMYTDLEYDGPEPFTAPGMLTNIKEPEQVQKPLPPDILRTAHQALTVTADELGILDYGMDQSTQPGTV